MITLVRGDRTVTLQQGQKKPVSLSTQARSVLLQRGGKIVAPRVSVNVNIDGGNSTLDIGSKGEVTFPFRVHLDKFVILSPQNGSVTVSLRQTTSASTVPPGPGDEVDQLVMTNAQHLTGALDLTMELEDVLGIALTATALVERISLTLFGDRL